MNDETDAVDYVSEQYFRAQQDPVRNAARLTAVWMMRDPDTRPCEPFQIALDRTMLRHMGWRDGEAVTLVPVGPEGESNGGGLIIRRARPGEAAFILNDIHTPVALSGRGWSSLDVYGPSFAWSFPASWVEAFFPGEYRGDEHDFDSQTERRWLLSEVLEQAEQLTLRLNCDDLFFYLQRPAGAMTSLSVHLAPGLLERKGWLPREPLILESASGFDPSGPDDQLTIRECSLGEEPNLVPTDRGFRFEVTQSWLDRFLPGTFDQDELYLAEDDPDGWLPEQGRDTFVVTLGEATSRNHLISFEIEEPRPHRRG